MKNLIFILICASSTFCLRAQIYELNTSFPEVEGNSRSSHWVDLNFDGYLDVFFTNGSSSGENNQAYLGFGNGNFLPYNVDSPVVTDNSPSVGASFAQSNSAIGPDLFVTTWYGEYNLFFRWSGDGYEPIVATPPADELTYSETGAYGDANQDGLLELYVTNSAGPDNRNHYYTTGENGIVIPINEGVQVEDQGASRCVNWIDYDNDGDADLFVTNEDNTPNRLYQNQGDGSFVSVQDGVLATNAGSTMSATWGDYNNDGYIDVFICNYGTDNRLYKNGPDGFLEITGSIVSNDGGFSFSASWGDIDNDGDLDLFVSNAFAPDNSTPLQNYLYLNEGNESFIKIETELVTQNLGWTYGNAFGDFDKDGDLDLITANCLDETEPNRLYTNLSSNTEDAPGWLEVFCLGTESNLSAIGTRVSILAEINGEEVWQTREITSQSSYCGQNMYAVHFGLGNADVVEQLVIDWPNSPTETYSGVDLFQLLTIVEGSGPLSTEETLNEIPAIVFPNPANNYVEIALDRNPRNPIHIQLFDNQGKELLSLGMIGKGEQFVRLELPSLPDGMYILSGNGEEGSFSRKVQIVNR